MEFPESQIFIQSEQTMEADCKLKQYVHADNHMKKPFRDKQTLMGRNDRNNLIW